MPVERGHRKTAMADGFSAAGGHSLLDVDQEVSDNKYSMDTLERSGDFVQSIKRSQTDTIATRITEATGAFPGSKAFLTTKLAVNKFLKIFPGQEETTSLQDAFKMMTGATGDEFFTGSLTPEKLQRSLQMKDIDFSDEELRLVFPILDIDGDGAVDLEEFLHFGMAATITTQRISSGIGEAPGTQRFKVAKNAVEKVLNIVPQHVLAYYSGKGELIALKDWIETIDTDGDGTIDPDELKDAMQRFGVKFSDDEVKLIFPILDIDNDGSFDLEELTNFIKVATRTNALQQRIVEGSGAKPGTQLFMKTKAAVYKLLRTVPGREELVELKAVFDIICHDGSGLVKKGALQNSLHRFDCDFSDEEADLVFSVLDLDGDGGVDLLEFTEFVKACSTTTQRIWAGCDSAPGTDKFFKAREGINKILQLIPGRDNMVHLVETFRDIDGDGSGQWSQPELSKALVKPKYRKRIEEAGMNPMSEDEVELIFSVLDRDKNGAIEMDTFIEFFNQASTLEMTLAIDNDVGGDDNNKVYKSPKSGKRSMNALGSSTIRRGSNVGNKHFVVDAAKAEKELKLSEIFARIHQNDPDLSMVCLSGLGLKDAHISTLAMALVKNSYVRSLYLQYNDITDKGAQVLADFIRASQDVGSKSISSITSVNLACNMLTIEGIKALQSVTGSDRKFKQANFKGNPGYSRKILFDANGIQMCSV